MGHRQNTNTKGRTRGGICDSGLPRMVGVASHQSVKVKLVTRRENNFYFRSRCFSFVTHAKTDQKGGNIKR